VDATVKRRQAARTPKAFGEGTMSLNIFLMICILGIDFMIYVLFQWIFGDKRSAIARQVALSRKILSEESARPYVVASQHTANGSTENKQSTAAAAAGSSSSGLRHGPYHQRIA
jgi:hypothetical protein